jgi:SNF2 family DNA or RNA helicase
MNKIPYEGFAYLPHQEEGVKWLLSREAPDARMFQGGILADDMGLGKTWQLIGLILNSPIKKTLLVVPASLLETWIGALQQANIAIYHKKTSSSRWSQHSDPKSTGKFVFIISYDRFVNGCKYGLVEETTFQRVVCDEAQNIRNGPKTRRFQALMKLSPSVRWLLTGTPFQNREDDLVNLFTWLSPSAVEENPISLLVRHCLLRRTYADLRQWNFPGVPPPYKKEIIMCKAESGPERKLLGKLLGRIIFAKAHRTPPFMLLELFMRMNQAMAHPYVYFNSLKNKAGVEIPQEEWLGIPSGKTHALSNLLFTTPKEPTIAFCTFTDEIRIVASIFKEQGYNHIIILNGAVGFQQRQDSIAEARALVQAGNQDVAFIVQWVAGGAGLNLQFCTRVILYTQHWNPAVIQQAIGRAHRIGQTEQVRIYSLVFNFEDKLNMDKRMRLAQRIKMEEAHEILSTLLEEDSVSRAARHPVEVDEDPS